MKFFTILLVFVPCLWAIPPQSIVLTTSNWLSSPVAVPNTALYNSITDIRFELRVHNWTQATAYSHIFRSNNFAIRFVQNADQLYFTVWPDASGTATAVITGRSDFIVRFQRDYANLRLTAEVWNIDGSNYVSSTSSRPSMAPTTMAGENLEIGDRYSADISGSVAYIRMYSTLVPLGTTPSTTFNGNMADWELEGNGNDLAAAGLNMSTVHGSLSYMDTPLIPPTAVISGISGLTGGQLIGQRAGSSTPIVLDGTGSYSVNNATIASCFWNIAGGDVTGQSISSNTNCLSSVSIYKSGQYTYNFTVTDTLGLTTTRTFDIGSVPSDDNGNIISIPSAIERITGPLIRSGLSPWPWYDIADQANTDIIGPATVPPTDGTVLTGTVTLSPCNGCPGEVNPVTITGSGTLFTTELTPGQVIWVWWNPPGEAAGTGRALFTVSTITDDTHVTTAQYYHYLPLGTYSGVQASKPVAGQLQAWAHEFPNTNNWDFYDDVLAMYRLYYRSGITNYLTYARNLADRWWIFGIDHAYDNGLLWIYKSFAGAALRATDGQSGWWANLVNHLELKTTFPLSPVPQGYSLDERERGYELEFDAIVATGTPDAPSRAALCTLVARGVNNLLAPAQLNDGSWYVDTYAQNSTYPYAGPGTFPWQMGVTAEGLAYAYVALGSSYCNDPTTQAVALSTWQKALNYIYTIGRAANRGMYYSTNYYANGQPGTWPTGSTTETGTVSGSSGGTTITGSGTSFTSRFLCNGGDYIGFDSIRVVYKVLSCSDDTHMVIDTPLPSAVSGSTFKRSPQMSSSCAPSAALYCEGSGDRALINTTTGAFGHYYEITGDATYLAYGNELFSAAYGGAADGPGGDDPPGGPGADGTVAQNYIDALPPCNTSAPPCGGYGIATYNVYGKGYGQGSGTGGASAFLGYSTTDSPADSITLPLSIKIDSVANAAKVKFTVTPPDAIAASTTCTAMPCDVVFDRRQGTNQLVQIQHLSASDQILATGQQQVLVLPSP